jgi:hypothetical protein
MPSYQLKNGTFTYVLDTGQSLPSGWTEFDHEPTLADAQAQGYVRMVPRTMYAIAADIFALTGSLPTPAAGTQKANIIADLFSGSLATGSQKWQKDPGPNAPSLAAVYAAITASNGLATFNAAQQLIMAAIYVVDNPNYLVNPSFDPTISINGLAPG